MILGNGISTKMEFITKYIRKLPLNVVNEDLWTPAATDNATIVWADCQA